MSQNLNEEVAVVTGAGRGIGRGIALSLAAQGAAIACCARTKAEIDETASLIANAGGRALPLTLDVCDSTAVRSAVTEVADTLGEPTILVNNAGTPGPAGLDWEVDADAWFECIDVIVRGAFLLSQAVIPGMIQRRAGQIINVASLSGTRAMPPMTATSIAKTALIRFSEGLAAELMEHNVQVFAVHPGVVRTRLLESYGVEFPEEWYVGPERAGALCAQLSTGSYGALSGRFLTIDDNLDGLLQQADDIAARELYTLRIQA